MKRLITIVSVLLLATVTFGWLRAKERSASMTIARLEQEQTGLQQQLAEAESEQKVIREIIARHAAVAPPRTDDTFSAALSGWLAAGDFSDIPQAIVPELRARLGLPETAAPDFVLVSKPTMQALRPPSPRKDDNLSDSLCALLSISPGQQAQIQSALTGARQEFAAWARQNVQRSGPDEEELVRYTLPADNDFSNSVTNRLLSSISDLIGDQRTALFRTYADTWFQIETGHLGGVTNTLSVLRKPGSDGQLALFYKLTRTGLNSSMSEGPGEIHVQYFPPAWRNIFPDGWPEVAQREGLNLPNQTESHSK